MKGESVLLRGKQICGKNKKLATYGLHLLLLLPYTSYYSSSPSFITTSPPNSTSISAMFLLLTHDSFLDEVSFNCSLLIAHMPQPLILDAETHQPNNNSHCVPHISLSMPFTCSCFISSVLLSSLSITPRLPARSTILQLCSSTSSFFSLRTCTTASSSSISSVSFSFTDLLEVSSCS